MLFDERVSKAFS